jgi:hypothetical protein
MYSAWIKIDDSLPWIELEGTFQSCGSRGSERKAEQSQNKNRQNVETRKTD